MHIQVVKTNQQQHEYYDGIINPSHFKIRGLRAYMRGFGQNAN